MDPKQLPGPQRARNHKAGLERGVGGTSQGSAGSGNRHGEGLSGSSNTPQRIAVAGQPGPGGLAGLVQSMAALDPGLMVLEASGGCEGVDLHAGICGAVGGSGAPRPVRDLARSQGILANAGWNLTTNCTFPLPSKPTPDLPPYKQAVPPEQTGGTALRLGSITASTGGAWRTPSRSPGMESPGTSAAPSYRPWGPAGTRC